MDDLIQTILSNTYTKTALYHRFALLREFSEMMVYRPDGPHDENIVDRLNVFLEERSERKETVNAMREWGEQFWHTVLTTNNIEKTLHDIYHKLESVPVFVMYVPVRLPTEELAEIGQWLRKETGEQFIIDMRVSSEIGIGCAFSINNQYHDYSYERRITDAHDAVVKMMKEYESTPVTAGNHE